MTRVEAIKEAFEKLTPDEQAEGRRFVHALTAERSASNMPADESPHPTPSER